MDVRSDQRDRNTALAERLGWRSQVFFVAGTIAESDVDGADVVVALHACGTATDEALARQWAGQTGAAGGRSLQLQGVRAGRGGG